MAPLPVSLVIRDETAFRALELLIAEASLDAPSLELLRGAGVYQLRVGDRSPASPLVERMAREKRVSLMLKNVTLGEAMARLFPGTGFQYSFSPRYQDIRISVSVVDTSLWDALEAITRSARESVPYLRPALLGDIFILERRRDPEEADPNLP